MSVVFFTSLDIFVGKKALKEASIIPQSYKYDKSAVTKQLHETRFWYFTMKDDELLFEATSDNVPVQRTLIFIKNRESQYLKKKQAEMQSKSQ